MEKCARFLSAAMLVLFCLLLCGGVLLGVCRADALSYPAAFAAALLAALLLPFLRRKLRVPPPLREDNEGRRMTVLLALCFLVQLGWVLLFRLEPEGDYATFWRTASDLAAGGPVSVRQYVALFPHILGYASLLGLVMRAFGTGPLAAPLLNVCLTTLSGFFLYRLLRRWRGAGSAACGLLLWSLYPSKILYNAMVLSEPWYTCLLLAVLWLAEETEARAPRPLPAALLGALAGVLLRLLNAARPIAAVPVLALLIWLVLLGGPRVGSARRSLLPFAAALLALYLLTAPLWTSYATRVLEERPASVPGYSLYVGLNPETQGSYSDEDMALLSHYRYEIPESSAEEAQREMLREARGRLESGTVRFGALFAAKLRTFLGNDEGGVYYSRGALEGRAYALLALYCNVWYYALSLFALRGAAGMIRERVRGSALLVPLCVIGVTLAQLLAEVASRYHYCLIPLRRITAAFCRGGREKPRQA